MKYRNDGSIQSQATPTLANAGRADDHALYRCLVTKVVYVDDPANITANSSNPRVLYDVLVLGGFASGQIISNCRLSSDLSGNDSFWERILRASTNDVSGGGKLADSDGDVVYVQFIQGHTGYPVIVACDQGIKTVGSIGAAKADGPRSLRQYNGVREEINSKGELTISVTGGSANADKGSFTPGSDGLITITTAAGATIKVDGKSGKITLSKGSTIIELDANSDKISLKGGFVELGASVSDFAVLFTELLTAFNTHTHNAPQAPSGTLPTTPPIAPMLQSVGSQTVKVQP